MIAEPINNKEGVSVLSSFGVSYDLNQFIDVPKPQFRTQMPRLSFSKGDQLSQNEALQKLFDGVSAFRLRISPDGWTLALDTEGPCNMTFSPAGVRTHHPLGRLLRQQGLEPPLSFLVAWEEDAGCWIAQYDGLTPPLPGKQTAKCRKRGRS